MRSQLPNVRVLLAAHERVFFLTHDRGELRFGVRAEHADVNHRLEQNENGLVVARSSPRGFEALERHDIADELGQGFRVGARGRRWR